MIRSKWCDAVCVIVICLAVIAAALFMDGSALGIKTVHDEDAEANEEDSNFTKNDLNGDWDTSSATAISLSDDGIRIQGDGAYELNGDLVIVESGQYVISGELSNGSIIIDAEDNSKVWIQLNGVSLSREDDACFKIEQADKVFLTLAEGSDNTMISGEEMSEKALEDGVDGTIFSRDDLTINGSGALSVTSGYKFGIAANDDLVITGGDITIDAKTAAIHVNDSLHIKGVSLNITAGSDALHAGEDILIAGGSMTIEAGDDGIHADEDVTIDNGTIVINSCYEGIEGKNITVNGGDILIYPTDDGLNATDENTSGMPFGGGPHMQHGRPGSMGSEADRADDTEDAESESIPVVTINGGKLTVINNKGWDADGIDSNGDIIINGGEVYVSLTGTGSNCALDYGRESGGECLINGGTVVACGVIRMMEEISKNSGQASIMYTVQIKTEDGDEISVTDEQGNTIVSWQVPCGLTCAVLSCPEMQKGNTYTVSIGDNTEDITVSDTAGK